MALNSTPSKSASSGMHHSIMLPEISNLQVNMVTKSQDILHGYKPVSSMRIVDIFAHIRMQCTRHHRYYGCYIHDDILVVKFIDLLCI